MFFSIVSRGQFPKLEPIALSQDYNISIILQDDHGFLWLGTSQGLVFFDGIEDKIIERIGKENSSVSALKIQNNKIWVGYEDGEIAFLEDKDRIFHSISDTLTSFPITGIYKTSDHLMIATHGQGLFYLGDEVLHISEDDGLSSNFINSIYASDDKVYLGTDQGVTKITQSKSNLIFKNFLENLPDQIISNITEAKSEVLIGTTLEGVIFQLNTLSGEVTTNIFKEEERAPSLIMHDGAIQIMTQSSVHWLPSRNTSEMTSIQYSIPEGGKAALIDEEFNIWISTAEHQLYKGSLFFSQYPNINAENVQKFAIHFGKLYLGTPEGIRIYNQKTFSLDTVLYQEYNITCILPSNDALIVGTYGNGIITIDSTGQIRDRINESNGLDNNSILDIVINQNQEIYASTLSGIYKIIPVKGGYNIASLKNRLAYYYALDLFVDLQENIWIGTDKRGLRKFSNGNVDTYEKVNEDTIGLKIGSVYSINADSTSTVWFTSTNLGIGYIEDENIHILKNSQLKENKYTSIIPTSADNFLLISASSIDLLDPHKKHLMYFDKEVGIESELSFTNNYFIDKSQIYFIHNGKMFSFQEPPFDIKIHPTTHIDRVESNSVTVPLSTTQFNQFDNNIRFSFTGSWLTDPEKLSYTYFLEGYDHEWHLTKDQSATYQRLPPGEYNFKVKSAENGYFTDEPIANYPFSINRAFYNTWWFYTLIILSFLGTGYWIYHRRKRSERLLTELNAVQVESQLINLKSQLNPHFLFNSFNTLLGLIEEDPKKGTKYTEKLTDYYRAILESGNEKMIPIEKELNLVRSYLSLLKERFGKNLKVKIEINKNKLNYVPPMSLQMLIENCVKHNAIGRGAILRISLQENEHEYVISNNINPKISHEKSTQIGLKNINKRYMLLSGKQITINSNDQYFEVRLPKIFSINT